MGMTTLVKWHKTWLIIPKIDIDETSSNAVEHLDKRERENTAHLARVGGHGKIASDVLKVCLPLN